MQHQDSRCAIADPDNCLLLTPDITRNEEHHQDDDVTSRSKISRTIRHALVMLSGMTTSPPQQNYDLPVMLHCEILGLHFRISSQNVSQSGLQAFDFMHRRNVRIKD